MKCLILFGCFYFITIYNNFCIANSPGADTSRNPAKVLHAEPVLNDFTNDLGSRKGEGQINTAVGYNDFKNRFDQLTPQLEIEYTPLNRLGIEIQLPYAHYFENKEIKSENLQMAAGIFNGQHNIRFLVPKKRKYHLHSLTEINLPLKAQYLVQRMCVWKIFHTCHY